jgi:heme-NO-binding protein
MHGVIFSSLRDFVTAGHGREAAAELFAGEPSYLLTESYPDERLASLVSRASAMTGASEEAIVHDFGVFAAQHTFTALYPAFYAIAGSSREFLLTFETRIHELVRATIPNAVPPQLTVTPLGEDGVEIHYDSSRQLCVLLRGLVEGTAAHYGETPVVDELTCMLKGDDACRFHVQLAPIS